jgi:hypothetical protein
MESTVKSTSQNGTRGGGATVSVPWWHYEIENVVVLKNNRGTDDNRVKKLDYCIQLDKTFFDRVKNDEDVTLVCPHESDLYQYWGSKEFTQKYEEVEGKSLRLTKTVKARDLLFLIAKERLETGRIYIMFMDSCNQSSWDELIQMTNLCCLSGDTEVDVVVDNSLMKVKMSEFVEIFPNYTDVRISSNDGKSVTFDKVLAVQKTKSNSKVIKITDSESGRSLRCTADHRIFTKNRGYVEAGNLLVTDELEII